MGRGLRGRVASRRQKAASIGLGTEGDRIVFGAVGKGGVGRKNFPRRKQTTLVTRAHPAVCLWPLLSSPGRQPRREGRRPAALVVFTVVRKVLVFVIVVVGVLFLLRFVLWSRAGQCRLGFRVSWNGFYITERLWKNNKIKKACVTASLCGLQA